MTKAISRDPLWALSRGAHTDWRAATVLAQDATNGLESYLSSGAWIAAAPVPGTFIINIRDMMARCTTDFYSSTLRRVLKRSTADPYSVALLFRLALLRAGRLPSLLLQRRSARPLLADHGRRPRSRAGAQNL